MFAAAGASGNALKVQRNLASARKPFRIFKARARARLCMCSSAATQSSAREGGCGAERAQLLR
jgi:hypothetical protein